MCSGFVSNCFNFEHAIEMLLEFEHVVELSLELYSGKCPQQQRMGTHVTDVRTHVNEMGTHAIDMGTDVIAMWTNAIDMGTL